MLLSNSNNGWFYTLNWLDNPHPNKTIKSITWSRHSPCCQKQIHVHGIHHSHWTIIVLLTKKNHVLHLSIKVKSNLKNHLNLCKSTGNQNINKYKAGPDTVVVPWHIYCYGNHPTTKVFANHGSPLSLASFTLSTFALTSLLFFVAIFKNTKFFSCSVQRKKVRSINRSKISKNLHHKHSYIRMSIVKDIRAYTFNKKRKICKC